MGVADGLFSEGVQNTLRKYRLSSLYFYLLTPFFFLHIVGYYHTRAVLLLVSSVNKGSRKCFSSTSFYSTFKSEVSAKVSFRIRFGLHPSKGLDYYDEKLYLLLADYIWLVITNFIVSFMFCLYFFVVVLLCFSLDCQLLGLHFSFTSLLLHSDVIKAWK